MSRIVPSQADTSAGPRHPRGSGPVSEVISLHLSTSDNYIYFALQTPLRHPTEELPPEHAGQHQGRAEKTPGLICKNIFLVFINIPDAASDGGSHVSGQVTSNEACVDISTQISSDTTNIQHQDDTIQCIRYIQRTSNYNVLYLQCNAIILKQRSVC